MGVTGTDGASRQGPIVSPVSLYSCLVTRHTGRAVRLGIQERLEEYEDQVLAVVDFRQVQLIDFSCADEVVAKLVRQAQSAVHPRAFFLFAGMDDRHIEPVRSALTRQRLAVAAERRDGRPLLLGSVSPGPARVWHEVCRLGRAAPARVAQGIGLPHEETARRLDELHRRLLLLRDGAEYLSFRRALAETAADRG